MTVSSCTLGVEGFMFYFCFFPSLASSLYGCLLLRK